jgi:predicted  nucleic acid-binding Zn-ribbon protein
VSTQPQDLGPGNIWFAVAFVVVMMVVAALVSAAADRMGHRAARRKLRIGKLRPRHVSTLIAVLSGVVISLVTVGLMFLVWKDFYRALTQWDNLNGKLATVQAETQAAEEARDQAVTDKAQAEADLTAARGQIAEQSIEIRQKVAQIAETRGKLSGAQSELGKSRGRLAELRANADRVSRELTRKQAEYAQANRLLEQAEESAEFYNIQQAQVRDQIRQEIDALENQLSTLETQISRAQTGRTVIEVGEQLGYIQVSGSAGLESALSGKLTEIKGAIEAQGLQFDPGSREKVVEFMSAFPEGSGDYLVRIMSAENVFEGDRVLLDFRYEELAPLVPAGTAIIDITIGATRATITGPGGERREISVPAQFDGDTLVDFAVEVESVFQRGARRSGFIASNGQVASPVAKLTQVAGDLIERPRPVRIQFVTKSSATALEGDVLADAQIHLTGALRQPRGAESEEAPADESSAVDEESIEATEPEPAPAPEDAGGAEDDGGAAE